MRLAIPGGGDYVTTRIIFQLSYLYPGHLWAWPIPIKFGVRVALHDEIKISNFCNEIFRGFRSTGGQILPVPWADKLICSLCPFKIWPKFSAVEMYAETETFRDS